MKRLNVFSGCTEFGSEVQAFKDRGHNVITLGMEGGVDIKGDIRDMHFNHPKGYYDFMIFHPPCTEFSLANYRLGVCKSRTPDLTIVEACFRIVEESKPKYWIIENPRGCLKHFIGEPQATIKYSDYGHPSMKPTNLWGNFPMFTFKTASNFKPWKESIPRSPKKRALVPYNLSLALCVAIENELCGVK